MLLNIAHTLPSSRSNGPGLRAVLWVQGCRIECAGCHNPFLWEHSPRRIHSVEEIAAWIEKLDVRGLTLSGGEPFEQSLALAELCRTIREAGRDVMAFSGFTHEELKTDVRPFTRRLLAEVDLLIDGPYIGELRCAEPLRGSSNQQLHFLTQRISPEEVADLPRSELIIGTNDVMITGFSIERLARMVRR